MRRRDALKSGLGALLAASALNGSALAKGLASKGKRVRPSDAAWPKPDDWKALADNLEGKLEAFVTPRDAVLKAHGGALNDDVKRELQNPFLIQEHSGGTQSAGWHKAWVAKPSAQVVIPKNASDLGKAIKFARRHNLRVVIKGGAHSYLGQSNAPDSLLIWTRDLRGLNLHDAFVPQGGEGKIAPRPAVSVASGEKFISLYDFVIRQNGRYVQGGGCTSVGVGGHMQTGGFGSFSKFGGLTCAGLIEAEIVTADGEVLIVNENQHADLFWALKGGGAGWGVTTRLTLATHDLPSTFGYLGQAIRAQDDKSFLALTREFLSFYRANLLNPHWGEQVTFSKDNVLRVDMCFQGLDAAAALAAWKPFHDWVAARSRDYTITESAKTYVTPARHWWDFEHRKANAPHSIVIDRRDGKETGRFWWAGNTGEVGIYLTGYESLWLPQGLLDKGRIEDLARALVKASRAYATTLHFNKGLAGATPARREEARKTAIHPSAIDAFALVIIASGQTGKHPGVTGHAPDEGAADAEAAAIASAFSIIRKLAPEAGSYSSEMGYNEKDWRRAAWGRNYKRLLAIKKKYDPDGFFVGHHQVGSEDWSADGFERL